MFTVILYDFEKKHNSTKRPTAGAGSSYEGTLKDSSSILSPSIYFKFGYAFNPSQLNYAYIQTFGRYYYITDWVFEGGRWLAQMKTDSLASWKTEIAASEQYVLRSRTDYDELIPDYSYATFAGTALKSSSIDNPWATSIRNGRWILGIISGDVLAGDTGTSWYTMDNTNFNKLREKLFGDISWLGITDFTDNLQKAILNPIQYISTVVWVPYVPLTFTASLTSIKIGYWEVAGISCKVLDPALLLIQDYEFDIPKHPQSNTLGRWITASDYTQYTLYFPPFGALEIPSQQLISSDTLYVRLYLDCTSKHSVMIVSPYAEYSSIIAQCYADVGIDSQLGQTNTDTFKAIGGVASGAVGLGMSIAGANPGGVLGGISGILSGIGDGIAPTLQRSGGGGGSMAELRTPVELRARYKLMTEEDIDHFGRPYCKKSKLSLLPGYVLCKDAEVECAATPGEMEEIVDALNTGFYYE